MMYHQLRETLDPTWLSAIVVCMFLINIAVRLIDQGLGSANE